MMRLFLASPTTSCVLLIVTQKGSVLCPNKMDELFRRGLEQVIRSERGEEWLAALWNPMEVSSENHQWF